MKKLLYVLLLLSAASIFAAHARAQIVVIVNSSVKSADVSKSDLRDIFTGATSSLKDGAHVTPVLLKDGDTHIAFLSTYVSKRDTAFSAGWRSLVFSGQASMPKSMDSETAVVDYVAHNAGTIGYISKATPHESVKVLTVR